MTIGEMYYSTRLNVLWIGQQIPPDTRSQLTQFRFWIEDSSPTNVLGKDSFLGSLAAVVFVQTDAKPLAIVTEIETHVARLLDYDCLVIVVAVEAGLSSIKNALTQLKIPSIWPTSGTDFEVFDGRTLHTFSKFGDPYLPHVRVYRNSPPVAVVANLFLSHGPKHPPAPDDSSLFNITGPAAKVVKQNHRLMLRRSFHDCTELHLTEFKKGRSADVQVFLAHATLRAGELAGRLLPFFVKVGPRRKIIREWYNYDQRVRHFVPFHLGPRLMKERCALGAHAGIIVGDFVEDAEGLGECSLSGRATTPLATLFDRTLRGWHYQARPERRHLYSALERLVRADIPKARLQMAMQMGAKRSPNGLRATLKQLPKQWILWGPIHGDLHTDNVLVRGSDAILIDFLSSGVGPLLVDHAALEVSLAVRVAVDDPFEKDAWSRVVRALFMKDTLETPPTCSDPTEPYAWLVPCVRQIRLGVNPLSWTEMHRWFTQPAGFVELRTARG